MLQVNYMKKSRRMGNTKVKIKTAHITKIGNEIIIQDLREHLTHVATLCREYMRKIECPAMGYIVGILHDAGKAAHSFQDAAPHAGHHGKHPQGRVCQLPA